MLDVVDGLRRELQGEILRSCRIGRDGERGHQSECENEQPELPESCGAMLESHVTSPFFPILQVLASMLVVSAIPVQPCTCTVVSFVFCSRTPTIEPARGTC